MNQGIMYARLGNAARANNDAKDLVDEFRMFFGDGTQLQELYMTPQMMTPATWDALAEAAHWSRANADVLVDTHWIGGDAGKSEPYGYASWSPRKGILCVRNPSQRPQILTLKLADAFELPQVRTATVHAQKSVESRCRRAACTGGRRGGISHRIAAVRGSRVGSDTPGTIEVTTGFTMRTQTRSCCCWWAVFWWPGGRGRRQSRPCCPNHCGWSEKPARLALNRDTAILFDKGFADAAGVGKQLAERIRRSTGFNPAVTPWDGKTATQNAIVLTAKCRRRPRRRGLHAGRDGRRRRDRRHRGFRLVLRRADPASTFAAAGLQPDQGGGPAAWVIPAVRIEDRPRFRWRGLLLDVARHFFSKEEVKIIFD